MATLGALSRKSRTAVSGIVCEQFGFYDARGSPQRAGCMNALRTLEAESRISLPAAQRSLHIAGPRLLGAAVAEPVERPPHYVPPRPLHIPPKMVSPCVCPCDA